MFNKCATFGEGDKRPWCPTKLDRFGRFDIIGNDWSYCDPNCPYEKDVGITEQTTTTPKPKRATTTFLRPTTTIATTTTSRYTTDIRSRDPTESGTWLPNGEEDGCGVRVDSGYVLGGNTAAKGEFPFAALLGYKNPGGKRPIAYKCGGTLINRRYVLTAAHCHDARDDTKQIIEVVIGEYDVLRDPDCPNGCLLAQRFAPAEVILHENYALSSLDAVISNDIALIRLDRLVMTINEDFDQPIMPVCLPPPYYGSEEPKEKV